MDFNYIIDDWAQGFIRSVEGDKLPPSALSDAKNTRFWHTGSGKAAIGSRPGFRLATQFVPSSGAIPTNYKFMINYPYPSNDKTSYSNYLACVAGDGSLRFKEPSDEWLGDTLTPPAGYPRPSTCIPTDLLDQLDGAVMNGRLLLVAGPIRRSLNGKTYKPFGVDAPGGQTGLETGLTYNDEDIVLPEDTYNVYITAYESTTGAESVPTYLGQVSTVLGPNSRQLILRVQLDSSNVQTDYWRVYVQATSSQAQAYLATTVKDVNAQQLTANGNIPIGSTTVYVNFTASELEDLIIPMPTLTDNTPMPDDVISIATFGQYLLAASRRKLYWSKPNNPDSFPTTNVENMPEGEIVKLMPFNEQTVLVLTKTGTYQLSGSTPQEWSLSAIDRNIGCTNKNSVVRFDGGVAWWSPQYGPVMLKGGQISKIATELYGPIELSAGQLEQVCAGWDPQYEHVMWAIPDLNETSNTKLLVFNYKLNRWVSERWDPCTINAMATGYDSDGKPRLYVMDSGYRLMALDHRVWQDGLKSGTWTGSLVGTGSDISTITSSGFYTESFGSNTASLANHQARIYDSNWKLLHVIKIASATSTVLTLDRVFPSTSGTTYYWTVDTPFVTWATPWIDNDNPFAQKRYDRIYADIYQDDDEYVVYVDIETNRNNLSSVQTHTITLGSPSTATLDATWDVSVTTSLPFKKQRLSVFKNSHVMRVVVRQPKPLSVVMSHMRVDGKVTNERYLT